jgi:hypothetical protein
MKIEATGLVVEAGMDRNKQELKTVPLAKLRELDIDFGIERRQGFGQLRRLGFRACQADAPE